MKKVIIFLFVLHSVFAFSQIKGDFSIKWSDKTVFSSDEFKFNVPQFQNQNLYFDDSNKTLSFVATILASNTLDTQSLKITNLVFEDISVNQLGDLDLKMIPSDLKSILVNNKSRNNISATLSLSPVIKNGQGFKRLKSFSYYINEQKSSASLDRKRAGNIQNSVLASGNWYRFYVEKSGVYKISKSFLQQLGLNLSNLDPRNIKIYGNGGRMLPLLNSVDYPIDLAENAIQFIGEEDGVFNDQDYILFYAEGLDNWSEENLSHNNLYASKSYYYVTAEGGSGKRIPLASPTSGGNSTLIEIFDDYQFYELDLNNIVRLGRKWFGESFELDDSQSFNFSIPNIVSSSPVNLSVTGAAVSFTSTRLDVRVNSSLVGAINFPPLSVNSSTEGVEGSLNTTIPASESVKVDLKYNNSGVPSSNCYLDYITLKSQRFLKGYGKQFRFQYNQASSLLGAGVFQIANAATVTQVWDITDIYNVSKYENNGQSLFSFAANLGEVRKYIAVDSGDYYTPLLDAQTKVVNQNLKGTIFKNAQGEFQDIDYLIITPSFLNAPAERLANFHRNYSKLNVKVVNLEKIYEEFSSGKQDIAAIRNFVRYVYENASSVDKRVKYLNLFGDASYDFKNRIPNNTNIVPIYHTLSSFSLLSSYISDDFFVLLDESEGNMNAAAAKGLDVAVGRMLVKDVNQANEMVNKVFEYHDAKSYGKWRNNVVLISDDVDLNGEQTLEFGLDALGEKIFSEKPFVNLKKIHTDSYVQETSAGGNRYPKAKEDFVNAFDQGALVFDYFGHGGEDGLAAERIFDKSDAQKLTNQYKYPLFVTITCEFTRFDNPYRSTCGEFMYWNPKGGAISMVTTTRQIGITVGQDINEAFAKNIFGFGQAETFSMAEALRISKSEYSYNPLMVFYIGDPAIELAMPKPKIVLTKINGVSTTQPTGALQALSPVKLSGEIRDESGNTVLSDYSGDLAVHIFDKAIDRVTLGNDGVTDGSGKLVTMNFKTLGETVFRGNASVSKGAFEFDFVVPKDIKIPLGNGRVSFYAKKSGQLQDQSGYDNSIQIGGVNTNPVTDEISPIVKIYMNDENFVSGGITNKSPILLVYLDDESGINTASGIGHDISAILDGNNNEPILLNDYYETEADNFRKGKLRFQFKDLAPGMHTLTFKAWDVYNNPVTSEIEFIVVGDEELTLKNVLNYPNPFVNHTQFWFTHNKPFEPLEVQVQVMTVTGKVVWTKNQIVTTEGFLSKDITWDGKDDFGDRLGKGVYVYRLTVKSTFSNKKAEKIEKLVIL